MFSVVFGVSRFVVVVVVLSLSFLSFGVFMCGVFVFCGTFLTFCRFGV